MRPQLIIPELTPSDAARFWAKVAVTPSCWLWLAAQDSWGYGHFSLRAVVHRAHRIAWFLEHGAQPPNDGLDHLCRVRHCVNPSHLEPVTTRENILRGASRAATNARQTQCIHGHLFDLFNTQTRASRAGRECRECASVRDAQRRAKPRRTILALAVDPSLSWVPRFWALVERTDGCWYWRGGRHVRIQGHIYRPRRLAYALTSGCDVQPGEFLWSACGVAHCIRPEHIGRRVATTKQRFCKRGHDLTVTRYVAPGGSSYCTACQRPQAAHVP